MEAPETGAGLAEAAGEKLFSPRWAAGSPGRS